MDDDLRQYVQTRSPAAFEAIVRRHVDAVYSQARRQLGDHESARDITQGVFVLLAQRAQAIPERAVLGGWLHKATRYSCLNHQRAVARRIKHEQQAAHMRPERDERDGASPPSTWNDAAPVLDEAMAQLKTSDRDALVLRYFEGRSMREIAGTFAVSEDAAKQRVGRALDRLRGIFARRGVAVPTAILGAWLESSAVHAAPPEVVALSLEAATTTSAVTTGIAGGAAKLVTLANIKLAASVALGLVVAGGVVVSGAGNTERERNANQPVQVAQAAPAPVQDAAQTDGQKVLHGLRQFVDAVERGDMDAVDRSVVYPEGPNAAFARTWTRLHAPLSKLTQAWNERFGDRADMSIRAAGLGMYYFREHDGNYEVLVKLNLARVTPDDVRILDGDRAVVPVKVTHEELYGRPPQDPSGVHQQIRMRKVSGAWRLDLGRSLIFNPTLRLLDGTEAPPQKRSELTLAFQPLLEKAVVNLVDDLEMDELKTPQEVTQQLIKAFENAEQEVGIRDTGFTILPAPPDVD